MENCVKLCELIKDLNEKILSYNYAYGKESEQSKFLKKTKKQILELYMAEKDIDLAITSAGEENKKTINFSLIATDITFDDNGNLVFVYIDLDSGKLCLGNDGGFPNLENAIFDNKEIKSDFKIERIVSLDEAFNLLGISQIHFNNASDYFTLLEYLKNNYSKSLQALIEPTIKR